MKEALETELCAAFCGGLEVHAVPSGFAVSSVFTDSSGDRITFYVAETDDGFHIEDDGDFLATLIARDIPITIGVRGEMLEAILAEGRAFWDRETFEIRTESFAQEEIPDRAITFLSALIRVRDLALVTKERVRSAFREDFLRAVTQRFGDQLDIEENKAPANDLAEFPADLVITPRDGGRPGAIYLVNSNDKLNEALLAWKEREELTSDVAMVAVIEDSDLKHLSRKRFQRAQNRRLPMPIFRGDESATLTFIGKELGIVVAG